MARAVGVLLLTGWVIAVRADCAELHCVAQTWARCLYNPLALLGLIDNLYDMVQALH